MNNFWYLVRFEFKKVFQRKAVWVAILFCIGCLAVSAFSSISGGHFWHKAGSDLTQYEAMKRDRATIQSKRGDITPELVSEAIRSNSEMIANDDNYLINDYGRHLKEDAYIKYVLPYEHIARLVNVVYEDDLDWVSEADGLLLVSIKREKAIDRIPLEEAEHFDEASIEFAKAKVMRDTGLSAAEVEKNFEMIDQIKRPLYNDYCGGYQQYIYSAKGLALTVMFMILLLLAPLFSNEYEDKVEQIMLCSKNGKSSLCKAKLFVSVTVSFLSSVLIMGIGWLSILMVLGFEGADVPIQVLNPSYTYPVTLLEACQIHFISVILASALFGSLIAFLSAKSRRTSSVIIVGTLLTIVPMFIWMPLSSSRLLYDLLQLFPVNAVTFGFDRHFIDIFGMLIAPYKFNWAVDVLLVIAFYAMAMCCFKNHQTT